MSTEPDQIRARIAALLADLPDADGHRTPPTSDIDTLAARLEEAHDLLVRALESVEKVQPRRDAGQVTAGDAARSC